MNYQNFQWLVKKGERIDRHFEQLFGLTDSVVLTTMALMFYVIPRSGMMRIDVNSLSRLIYHNSLPCLAIRGMLSFRLELFSKLHGNFIPNPVSENLLPISGRFMGGKFSSWEWQKHIPDVLERTLKGFLTETFVFSTSLALSSSECLKVVAWNGCTSELKFSFSNPSSKFCPFNSELSSKFLDALLGKSRTKDSCVGSCASSLWLRTRLSCLPPWVFTGIFVSFPATKPFLQSRASLPFSLRWKCSIPGLLRWIFFKKALVLAFSLKKFFSVQSFSHDNPLLVCTSSRVSRLFFASAIRDAVVGAYILLE